MKIPSVTLKKDLLLGIDRPFSRKFSRFIEALVLSLDRSEYGPDGLLLACVAVLEEPEHDLDARDGKDILKRMADNAYLYFDNGFADEFREAVRLWP